jgi:mono/diheme cytochrome c family protein
LARRERRGSHHHDPRTRSRALVVTRVIKGKGAMSALAGQLSPAQIAEVADYVAAASKR